MVQWTHATLLVRKTFQTYTHTHTHTHTWEIMDLLWDSLREVDIFSRVVTFLSKICPPHTQLV